MCAELMYNEIISGEKWDDDEEEGIIYSTLMMVEEKIQIIFTLCHNCVCNMLAE